MSAYKLEGYEIETYPIYAERLAEPLLGGRAMAKPTPLEMRDIPAARDRLKAVLNALDALRWNELQHLSEEFIAHLAKREQHFHASVRLGKFRPDEVANDLIASIAWLYSNMESNDELDIQLISVDRTE